MGKKTILISGASGFVGKGIIPILEARYQIKTCSLRNGLPKEFDESGVDGAVIHLSGIAHQKKGTPEQLYYDVNENLALEFAKQTKAHGFKHFMFVSTIKVYGEDTLTKLSITESTPCKPTDAYGQSKYNAEQAISKLAAPDFVVTIVRLPLVLGPNAKGNLLSLMKLAKLPLPLPLGGIQNSRSMISITNLALFFQQVLENPKTGIYLPLDPRLPSTSELVREIRKAMGFKNPMLLKFPLASVLKSMAPGIYIRLFESNNITNPVTLKAFPLEKPVDIKISIKEMVGAHLSR